MDSLHKQLLSANPNQATDIADLQAQIRVYESLLRPNKKLLEEAQEKINDNRRNRASRATD